MHLPCSLSTFTLGVYFPLVANLRAQFTASQAQELANSANSLAGVLPRCRSLHGPKANPTPASQVLAACLACSLCSYHTESPGLRLSLSQLG